jgi:hypothetical protein
VTDYPKVPGGTFGQLVGSMLDLRSSSGIEILVNLALMGGFCFLGYSAGRWIAGRSLAASWIAAAVAGLMFLSGAQAHFFVVNAGIAYLGFLYPVWEESYRRFSTY